MSKVMYDSANDFFLDIEVWSRIYKDYFLQKFKKDLIIFSL